MPDKDGLRSAAESKPNPDPTTVTNDAIERAVKAERDYMNAQLAIRDERLNGIDRATVVLEETVNRTPTEIQKQIGHSRELSEEKFASVAVQFKERDTRAERESRDNKVAVDAAFAAQKEAATKQDEANQKAIDKSERATNESIMKLGDVVQASVKALSDKIDDLKVRQSAADQAIYGISQNKQGGTEWKAGLYALVGALAIIGGLIISLTRR